MVSDNIFRTYDIRGKVPAEINEDVAFKIGKAFGSYARWQGAEKLAVGMDNRSSSPVLNKSIIQGLCDAGCAVVNIGLVVTPILYYALNSLEVDGGIMITGSHNPGDENGFKIALGKGTIYGEDIQELKRIIVEEDYLTGEGTVLDNEKLVNDYLDMLRGKIQLGPYKLKVAIDCGNGTAGLFAEKFLTSLGCEVIPLYCVSDSSFPNHHPDPVKSSNLRDLVKVVKESGADLGVAYDGDGDRIGVVDESGEIIWGDKLMALYWREILPKYPGTQAIIEVKCSQSLVDEVIKLGGRPMFYKTGHSLIKAKMKELGAVFTGEMSGHMFFADEYYGFDDAFYATGRLLRILSQSSKSLSELLSDVPQYCSTGETRVPCSDEHKFDIVNQLKEELAAEYEIVDVDGVRVLFPDGWGLVRCSNTQPVLVARCEAKTEEGLNEIADFMKEKLCRYSQVGQFEWEY